MVRRTIVQGDTEPLEMTLVDENGPVSLLNATMVFRMRPTPETGLSTPYIVGTPTAVDPAALVGDPDRGKIVYAWAAHQTDVSCIYHAEVVATYPGNIVKTFPSEDPQEILIRAIV